MTAYTLTERRLAYALAWDFSVAGKMKFTPRAVFMAQSDGCRERFLMQARELLHAMGKAGLKVYAAGMRRRA